MYAHTKKRVRYFLIPIFIVLASGALISVFFLILSCDFSLLFRRIGFSILVKSMPIILPIQLSSFFGIVFSSLAWLIINLESFEYFSMMGESAGPSSSASTNWEKYLNLSSDKGENPEPESSTGHNRPPEEEAEASSKRKVHEDEQAGPSSKRGKVNSESSFQSSEPDRNEGASVAAAPQEVPLRDFQHKTIKNRLATLTPQREVDDDQVDAIICLKEAMIDRMAQLDPHPFWAEQKDYLVAHGILNKEAEYTMGTLEKNLDKLRTEGQNSFVFQKLKKSRENL